MKTNLLLIIMLAFAGSYSYSQWQPTSVSGTYATCFAANDTGIFAGTGKGIYFSSDTGNSWIAIYNGLNDTILSLAISGNNIFAGTNGGGVFLSNNNGNSWTAVNSGLTNLIVQALTIIDSNIFAGTNGGGIFLSTNNGGNWQAVNNGLINNSVQVFTGYGNNIFAGTNGGGIFLSTNNGANWSAVNNGLTNTNIFSFAISGNNVFAGTESFLNTGGVYLSDNDGASWSATSLNQNVFSLVPNGSSIIAGCEGVIFLSDNNGISWSNFSDGLPNYTSGMSLIIFGNYIFTGIFNTGIGIWRRPLSEMTSLEKITGAVMGIKVYPNPASGNLTREIRQIV